MFQRLTPTRTKGLTSRMHPYPSEALAALPQNNGFRQRGMDMTRLETFADAAFAFAVTLLVVGGGDSIPADFNEMILALKQVPAFAASIANIMLFWYAHHIWSRRFGLDDRMSVFLTVLLVFVVLVFVYPLKAIYSGALDYFSGGYFPSYFVISSEQELRNMFIIFGAGYAAMCAVIVLLNRHALTRAQALSLSPLELFDLSSEIARWLIYFSVAIVSIVLALVLPANWLPAAGIIYASYGILMPLYAIRRARQRTAIGEN